MCLMHYKRFIRHGTTDKPVHVPKNRKCSFNDCDKPHECFGYCVKHSRQFKKYGKPKTDEEMKVIVAKMMSKRSKGNQYVLGKRWKMDEIKKLAMVGIRKNTGRTHFKKGATPWNKGLKGYRAGELSHLWAGGVTPENKKIRSSLEYKEWRKAVFERDGFMCVECGDKTSGNLNADHIKPFALFPELRLDINNGRTLCVPCHKLTDSYMNRNIKKENYIWQAI